MAILLGSGSPRESALDLAKRLLSSVDQDLHALSRLGVADFCRFRGIGEAKAIALIAALELGKRQRLAQALQKPQITSSQGGFEILQPLIGHLNHEEFWILLLSNANRLLDQVCISKGGITGTIADVRLIFREALQRKATALILAHNHPSGKLKPSAADRALTKKLREAGELMDISILDHLIIGADHYFSFADEGLL